MSHALEPKLTGGWLPVLAISWLALGASSVLRAAAFQAGDVTADLGPTFFVDDAAAGGSDTDINQPATPVFDRNFNGLLVRDQGPTRISLTGFGFATHTSPTANDATSVAVTFTYLGADELPNTADDVAIGTATGTFAFVDPISNPDAEYGVVFDAPLTADLDITGTRFRIRVAPSNTTGTGSLKLKTGALAHETVTGTKLSVAGFIAPRINPERVNLAKFQPVTVSSTAGQYRASYLTDGVTGNDNRWQGGNSTWQSASVSFPFPVEVGSAQVFTGVDDSFPISGYGIQYWNGTTWVSIAGASVTGNTSVERNLVFTSPVTASSFRFISSEVSHRIRELALYPPNGPSGYPLGTDLTHNLAYQKPADASANTAGNFALHAVDGRADGPSWQTSTAATNTLDIDLLVSTKIGSAHVYSGSTGISPLGSFTLKYWNGSAWQNITGGTVTGNTTADLVVSFTPVTTSMVRLSFTNPGTTSVRELCIFPANTGNTGYPINTGIINSGAFAKYETFNDSFYKITNPSSGRFIAGSPPALDQAGITTAQGQYQVLLNLSSGTYRLRNRSTGNCLSGAQLSVTPGLPLTDAPYTALPHQDWILDPLGGGHFRLINQWSGLAIDTQASATTAGTPLVQNTASSSSLTQRWRFSNPVVYPKKGIGGTSFALATDPAWAYNWGRTNNQPTPDTTSYCPMQWGNYNWNIGDDGGPLRQEYPSWRKSADSIHLMGFNEPDARSQSGGSLDPLDTGEADFSITRSANEAVRFWPRLQAMDLPLVSPAPANSSNNWFSTFFTQADNLGYRVDYTAVHTYPSPNNGSADELVNFVQTTYNTWDRPVWLTEFSFVNWSGSGNWTEEDNYNCLAEFLWRAEGLTALRKYALFVFTEDSTWPAPANPWSTVGPRSNSYDNNGNLTAFGKLYAAWDNDAVVRTGKTYHVHNKDTRKRLANTLASTPGGRSIRVDDSSVRWTLAPTGTTGRYYLVSSRDGRRLSSAAGAAPAFAASGTTGADVEWTLTQSQYGWYYIGHPSSGKRLQLTYGASNSDSTAGYSLVAGTTTTEAVQWRFIVPAPSPVWTGTASSSWTDPNAWLLTNSPAPGETVTFNDKSIANLTTTLGQNFSLGGLLVQNPAANVTIGGTHTLTLGSGGIDLTAATRDLTITAPLVLGAAQTWNVTTGRDLSVNGGITGAFALGISGTGTTSIGGEIDPLTPLTIASGSTLKTTASSVLASGAAAVNPTLNGTLDLNGTTQSVNFLTGSGVIDNTAAGAASITMGNHDTGGTLSTIVQNTGGPLTLIKTGSAGLTLPVANTHTGGFTNHGSGNITPQNNASFGSGPVVMNGAILYAASANYTFTNSLALNGATLRVGGANSRTLVWNGPVTATGASGISADGGTSGVTLGGPLDITGATFTSFANGNLNNINGPVTGAGGSLVASGGNGTLVLSGTSTYGGSTLIVDNSFLRLSADGTLPETGGIEINGGLTIRNTVGWVHSGTITGDGTGVINLNTGTNATLAGPISGITSINVNNTGTDATVSGIISGGASVNVQSQGGILRLGGANSYSGVTTVAGPGTLIVNGNQSAATGAVSVSLGTLGGIGTLGGPVTVTASGSLAPGDLAPATTVGTLSMSGGLNISAPVNGGAGKLRFDLGPVAASDKLVVASTLTIGSGFLGFSDFVFTALAGLENGTYPLITSSSISGSLSSVPANLTGSLGSGVNGRLQITGSNLELVVTGIVVSSPYSTWSGGAAFEDDANADGVANGMAFLLGSATPGADALGRLPAASRNGGSLVLTFDCLPAADRGNATLELQHAAGLGLPNDWTSIAVPGLPGNTTAGDVQFVVTDPAPAGGLLRVLATVQVGQPTTGSLFARLRSTQP